MALNAFASRMHHYSATHGEFMRAETKPPGGFVISPEIPAALDHIVISRTLCGFASEQRLKFPGSPRVIAGKRG
jgi:hypothetical protein